MRYIFCLSGGSLICVQVLLTDLFINAATKNITSKVTARHPVTTIQKGTGKTQRLAISIVVEVAPQAVPIVIPGIFCRLALVLTCELGIMSPEQLQFTDDTKLRKSHSNEVLGSAAVCSQLTAHRVKQPTASVSRPKAPVRVMVFDPSDRRLSKPRDFSMTPQLMHRSEYTCQSRTNNLLVKTGYRRLIRDDNI